MSPSPNEGDGKARLVWRAASALKKALQAYHDSSDQHWPLETLYLLGRGLLRHVPCHGQSLDKRGQPLVKFHDGCGVRVWVLGEFHSGQLEACKAPSQTCHLCGSTLEHGISLAAGHLEKVI